MDANVIGNLESDAVAIHILRKLLGQEPNDWIDDFGEDERGPLVLRKEVRIVSGVVITRDFEQHAIVEIHELDAARVSPRFLFWIEANIPAELKSERRVNTRHRAVERQNLGEVGGLGRLKTRIRYLRRADLGVRIFQAEAKQGGRE